MNSLEFETLSIYYAKINEVSLLFRYKRHLKDKYELLKDKELHITDLAEVPKIRVPLETPKQSPSKPSLPPPIPPPPPVLNWKPVLVRHVFPSGEPQPTQPGTSQGVWRPTAKQTEQMVNNLFMEELFKAFKTFNVDANKTFENAPDK